MGRQTKIVPEFMIKHPNDTFRIILPLNLKLDYENYGNSYFNVIIKNKIFTSNWVKFSYKLEIYHLFIFYFIFLASWI